MSQQFAVIGLGWLGSSLAKTLDRLGHDVLGIDLDPEIVQDLSEEMPGVHLVVADATEASVLRELGLETFDGVAVLIGENLQAGILATMNVKEIGVPMVVARAATDLHRRVLEKLGADRVILPEQEMGEQLARTMSSSHTIMDYLDLGDDEAVVEIRVPDKWVGKNLASLHLYQKSGLTVLAHKCKGEGGTIPHGDTTLREGDVLLIGGPKEKLDKFEPLRT